MSAKESQLPNSQAATDVQPAISIAVSNAIKLEDYSDIDKFRMLKSSKTSQKMKKINDNKKSRNKKKASVFLYYSSD